MTAHKLYSRVAVVSVDTVQVECGARTGLALSFDVDRSLKSSPNTCELKIINLAPEHRKQILARGAKKQGGSGAGIRVRIDAGYVGETPRIFEGDLHFAHEEIEGTEVILSVSSGDGIKAIKAARVSKSFGPGTAVEDVIREVGLALGVGKGNLLEKIRGAVLQGWGNSFTQGTVIYGNAVKEMNRLTKSAGLEWSIQDGQLQLIETAEALSGTAVVINRFTGLEGSPNIDQKGIVSAKLRMIPGIIPGRKIRLESNAITGIFRVERAKYTGDTHGEEWGISVEARRV